MLKRMFSGIILVITLSVLTVVSSIQPVEAVTIFYIRPDGLIWPLDANKYIMRVGDVFYYFFRDVNNLVVIQRSNIVLDGDGHTLQGPGAGIGLFLEEQSNVTIRNMTIKGWEAGVYLNSSSLIRIVENNMYASLVAVYLRSCRNNFVYGNSIANNYFGIYFFMSSDDVVSENYIVGNLQAGIAGIGSYNMTISGNTITQHDHTMDTDGITLSGAVSCTISGNDITHNSYGIELLVSSDNIVSENDIMYNDYGVKTEDSVVENRFYHNNFHENYYYEGSWDLADAWDDGCEGNYWSDYTAVDSDGDGIWDTPYVINGENVDRYPLVNVYWNPADINHDLKVDMKDVAAVCKAYGSIPGFPNWNCHVDITGPTPLEPDGQVDMRDVALIAKYYGEIY